MYGHRRVRDPGVGQAGVGEPGSQGLQQIHRFAGHDPHQRIGQLAVVHSVGHVVGARRRPEVHLKDHVDDEVLTVGPFEVENALMAHPAVAEAAVVGAPDLLRGEAVTAFVVAAPGVTGTPELAGELQLFVKSHLAAHLYPRQVHFAEVLPRTPSGKVQRTILRQQACAQAAQLRR